MSKKGDTLIEVCIAIGIFSLVAIGVASVMSSGTAGSQTALETTITRKEIDAQGDALRFIHESYISGKNATDNSYANVWKKITEQAVASSSTNTIYSPDNCAALYSNNTLRNQKAFIINTRELSNPDKAITTYASSPDKFTPTTTYPRVLFGSNTNNTGSGSLLEVKDNLSDIYRVEGLYVIAIKDPESTQMVVEGETSSATAAYYDFYIRSCWYGTDSERPTAISTVIRLYDPPDIISTAPSNDPEVLITYNNLPNTSSSYSAKSPVLHYDRQQIKAGKTEFIADPTSSDSPYNFKWRFLCWSLNTVDCNGEHYVPPYEYKVPVTLAANQYPQFYAIWNNAPFKIRFNANGGKFSDNTTVQQEDACAAYGTCETTGSYAIPSVYLSGSTLTSPDPKKYNFSGWSIDTPQNLPEYGGEFGKTSAGPIHKDTTFYAAWKPYYWVDINVFKDKPYGGQSTGGYTGFTFDMFINGEYAIDRNNVKADDVIDFYRELPDESHIKVVFTKRVPNGYRSIQNWGSMCSKLGDSCQTRETSTEYIVEFDVNPSLKSDVIDSSGHYSIQVEPVWVK